MSATVEHIAVCDPHCIHQQFVANRAPIDEPELLIRLRTRGRRQTHPAAYFNGAGVMLHWHRPRDEVFPENLPKPPPFASIFGCLHIEQHTLQGDILIVAIGKPEFVTGDMVKPGAVVIDVGINRLPDGKLAGDVDFAGGAQVASRITPVPGGVGPMTIAMLLGNTLDAAERSLQSGARAPARIA